MVNLLKELMNRGFLIYQENSRFVLRKERTPADNRCSITDDVVSKTHCLYFDTYDEALDKAMELIS